MIDYTNEKSKAYSPGCETDDMGWGNISDNFVIEFVNSVGCGCFVCISITIAINIVLWFNMYPYEMSMIMFGAIAMCIMIHIYFRTNK